MVELRVEGACLPAAAPAQSSRATSSALAVSADGPQERNDLKFKLLCAAVALVGPCGAMHQ